MRRFRDFYGNSAYIRNHKNGSATLLVYVGTKLVKRQDYKCERGARIALGRFGDSFLEVE